MDVILHQRGFEMFDAKDTFQTFLGDGCLLACLGCISPASLVTEENPMEGLSQSSVINEKEKKKTHFDFTNGYPVTLWYIF